MRNLFLLSTVLFCFALAGLGADAQSANAQTGGTVLMNEDCQKCHLTFVQQVEEAGSKHKTEVVCLECHDGTHPPGTEKGSLIPQCSNCHEGEPHFTLDNCLQCHTNPHQPLKITFSGEVKPACNTCHSNIVAEIDAAPSAHTEVDCSFCHDKHGYIPDCLSCHETHIENQKFDDCVRCHQVHQPLTLAYGTDVPNRDCGACHGEIRANLEAGPTKHAGFDCIFCHANKHAVVPQCQDCHGEPHNTQMLSKFQGCNDCHRSAHTLLK